MESHCRDITRPCAEGADPGTANIFATRSDHDSLLISVNESWIKPFWRTVVRDFCPRGRIETPIEQLDPGHFSPGERGEAHRIPTTIGTWRGILCGRRFDYVFPAGYALDPGDPRRGEKHTLLLTNGFHYLQVQTSSSRFTRQLAEEYLDRLGSLSEPDGPSRAKVRR